MTIRTDPHRSARGIFFVSFLSWDKRQGGYATNRQAMKKTILIVSILASLSACKFEPSVILRDSGFPTIVGAHTIAGEMRSLCSVQEVSIGGKVGFITYNNWATFYNPSWYVVSAGDVQLNGISLKRESNAYGSHSNPSFGSSHHWHVTSNLSGSVPAMDDSVQSPNLFHVTYPRELIDTVSKSAGFNCTYGNPGTDSVAVLIFYDPDETWRLDSSIHHSSSGAAVHTTVANTGSCVVGSSLLASLPNSGVLQVWVRAFRSKKLRVSGRTYKITSECEAQVFCFIKS